MWLALFVLFTALSPGVLFTIPSLGKKMGGKVVIALMHAVLFVIVVNLLYIVEEGFQVNTTQQLSGRMPAGYMLTPGGNIPVPIPARAPQPNAGSSTLSAAINTVANLVGSSPLARVAIAPATQAQQQAALAAAAKAAEAAAEAEKQRLAAAKAAQAAAAEAEKQRLAAAKAAQEAQQKAAQATQQQAALSLAGQQRAMQRVSSMFGFRF